MGLDMYLTGEKFLMPDFQNRSIDLQEDGFRLRSKTVELGYWRKHPDLPRISIFSVNYQFDKMR